MSARWALFISGRGSTAQAVLDILGQVDVQLVVSSRAAAPGLLRARRLGVPTMTLPKDIQWDELHRGLKQRRIDQIFLLGFMRIVPEIFLQHWSGKIWNVHPSLLPAFAGAKALERSLEAGGPIGISIHDVIPEMDAGPLRMQKTMGLAADYEAILFSAAEQSLVREWALTQSLVGDP